jgi:hypothetical protein
MGVDYIQLNGASESELEFTSISASNGRITVAWEGAGVLESASSVLGPWTAITPAPTSPYSADIVPNQNLFYRLRSP